MFFTHSFVSNPPCMCEQDLFYHQQNEPHVARMYMDRSIDASSLLDKRANGTDIDYHIHNSERWKHSFLEIEGFTFNSNPYRNRSILQPEICPQCLVGNTSCMA